MGTIVSEETICYFDNDRKILCYGVGVDGPACLRAVWLESRAPRSTVMHSWDTIGGYPAWFSTGHIASHVLRGFNAQHKALKTRVEFLAGVSDRVRTPSSPSEKEGNICSSIGKILREKAPIVEKKNQSKTENARTVSPTTVSPCLGVCLVTGGRGLLGSHLARQLSCLPGSSVHIVSAGGSPANPVPDGVREVNGDVSDPESMARIVRTLKPNVIFHVDEIVDWRPGYSEEVQVANVAATQHLLRLAKRQEECSTFVLTSSMASVCRYNTVSGAKEDCTPYPAHPTNG